MPCHRHAATFGARSQLAMVDWPTITTWSGGHYGDNAMPELQYPDLILLHYAHRRLEHLRALPDFANAQGSRLLELLDVRTAHYIRRYRGGDFTNERARDTAAELPIDDPGRAQSIIADRYPDHTVADAVIIF